MAVLVEPPPPCVRHEDDDLLVVDKPPGWNTHAPSPHAGEGIYDWLRHREPRWAKLAIVQRLDKETSGVLLFSKSARANVSLTRQFAEPTVDKRYLLLTDRRPAVNRFEIRTALRRVGDRYQCHAAGSAGAIAVTRFQVRDASGPHPILEAQPLTGKTHQIRAHAAHAGIPILGDPSYGGTPAPRLCLHAVRLVIRHPATDQPAAFESAPDFGVSRADALRRALIDGTWTNVCRLIHGAADDWPGWTVDRLGDFLLSQASQPLEAEQRRQLEVLATRAGARGVYHKLTPAHVRRANPAQSAPGKLWGETAPARFPVRENGLQFALSFEEGYSTGLFLDQRDNRRRLLRNHVSAGFTLREGGLAGAAVLNLFAYTCGFSACAARAGALTTSIDLSRKALDWGKDNFRLNQLDPGLHQFLYGDAFDWLRRLTKQGRRFDVVLLDPPTFSQSKSSGAFQARKDYGRLVARALPLLRPDGVLFASCNAAGLDPEPFLDQIRHAFAAGGRSVRDWHYAPQPPDFPVSRAEPAYLKTAWIRAG